MAGALVAPFGEEILFRGFATTAWVRGMGPRRGLIVGALFFAFAHVLTVSGSSAGDAFELAVVAFVGRIPVALVLGWLFLRRGTIWASFGLHAAFNGLLLVAAELAAALDLGVAPAERRRAVAPRRLSRHRARRATAESRHRARRATAPVAPPGRVAPRARRAAAPVAPRRPSRPPRRPRPISLGERPVEWPVKPRR